jgi:phenylacetate-CoA ligase
VGLEQPGIMGWVTGKFVMEVKRDADENEVLSVVVELAPGEPPSHARREAIAASIAGHVCRLNSEFKSYVPAERRAPEVTLVATGDPAHFPAGVKHRYTRRPG